VGELHLAGARAIDSAALDALRRHRGRSSEPYLVSALFRDPLFRDAIRDAVDRAWGNVLVRSVLIHQKPQVWFYCRGRRGRCSCELGDALVVYRERLRRGQARSQAVLCQAKKWVGPERGRVEADPVQYALYAHWPPFAIRGGPRRTIRLPPGDYGRVLGLVDAYTPGDVPRVSPRRPTYPACSVEATKPWVPTIGTLGRAIRGLVRFELGEPVENEFSAAVRDMILRVSRSSPGPTYGPRAPRGGRSARFGRAVTRTPDDDELDNALDWLLQHGPPGIEGEAALVDERGPMTVMVIDSEQGE
jgi:hypothetical protein